MNILEYITRDIDLSQEQYEAICSLAEICGMQSLFEGSLSSLRKAKRELDEKKAETAAAKPTAVTSSNDKIRVPSWSEIDDDQSEELDLNDMFGLNNDLSSGITDDNADVGDSGVDYDFTNPERYVEPEHAKETEMQRDTRNLINFICKLAEIDRDTSCMYENIASDAVDLDLSNNDLALQKIKDFLVAMPEANKRHAFSDELTEAINNYGEEHPDSPLLKCLADFSEGVIEAYKTYDKPTQDALSSSIMNALGIKTDSGSYKGDEREKFIEEYGFDPVGVKPDSAANLMKMQKFNALQRVKNKHALSKASVGFVNPADETKQQAALDQLAQRGLER